MFEYMKGEKNVNKSYNRLTRGNLRSNLLHRQEKGIYGCLAKWVQVCARHSHIEDP